MSRLLLALMLLPLTASAADDVKISYLEQEVRNLQRQVQALTRQLDEIRNRPAGRPPASCAAGRQTGRGARRRSAAMGRRGALAKPAHRHERARSDQRARARRPACAKKTAARVAALRDGNRLVRFSRRQREAAGSRGVEITPAHAAVSPYAHSFVDEPLADLLAHLRRFLVGDVVTQQLPVLGIRPPPRRPLFNSPIDLLETRDRRERVEVAGERQVRARRDQRVHLRGREVVRAGRARSSRCRDP